jgi:hypothetical protein
MTLKTPLSSKDRMSDTLLNKKTPFGLRPGFLIGILVVLFLVIGLIVATQYGESVDEPARINYAYRSLQAYRGSRENLQDEKGPFYGMLALLGSKVLVRLFPDWKSIDAWHYMSFLAFVIGVFFFYRLCRRLIDLTPAIAATLLFGSQPLLWGHAFINPKDTPFMAFFLASVCLGLEMVDHLHAHVLVFGEKLSLRSEIATLHRKLAGEWASASGRMRRLMTSLGLLLAVLGLSYPFVRLLIAVMVRQAYNAPPSNWLGRLFRQVALYAGQIPVQSYIGKAQKLYFWLALAIGICLGLAFVWAVLRVYPTLRGWLIQPRVLLAGCFLGFCSDIRTLGPASGLLVAVYFLYKGGRKAIPYLLEYLGTGAVISYIFWPYLWQNPLSRYISSLSEAADFPWTGKILFAGKIYPHGQQPAYFLPAVFTIQFTETALILILGGILLAGFYLIMKPNLRMDMLLPGVWFVAPVVAAILLKSTIYTNFRQFLFVVPPLFFFASLALQAIWKRLKHRLFIYVPLVILIILPGLYWDWQLHPYQYVYYNSLVGGVSGAIQDYEAEYWFVSYKEAMEYVNQIASKNSLVYFWGRYITALPYARPDLQLTSDPNLENMTIKQMYYAVIPTYFHGSSYHFPRSKVIYEIRRGGALLAVVKQVNSSDYLQDK